MAEKSLQALQERIGYRFSDPALLARALQHSSWAQEQPAAEDNQRLEFLGDAVLGLLAAEHLHRRFDAPEGVLTRARKELVSAPPLGAAARELDLGPALRLGRGTEREGGRGNTRNLAAAFEAVLGAVYLDGGLEAARGLFDQALAPRVAAFVEEGRLVPPKHPRTELQERLQATRGALPEYRFEQLSDVPPRYRASVFGPDGDLLAEAEARSKGEAATEAARRALAGEGSA